MRGSKKPEPMGPQSVPPGSAPGSHKALHPTPNAPRVKTHKRSVGKVRNRQRGY